jgi:2-phosphosulfolactate phosphatase
MTFSQTEFDIRLEWGEHGVNLLAPTSDVVIIVDMLSISTSVELAASRQAIIYPLSKRDEFASENR